MSLKVIIREKYIVITQFWAGLLLKFWVLYFFVSCKLNFPKTTMRVSVSMTVVYYSYYVLLHFVALFLRFPSTSFAPLRC